MALGIKGYEKSFLSLHCFPFSGMMLGVGSREMLPMNLIYLDKFNRTEYCQSRLPNNWAVCVCVCICVWRAGDKYVFGSGFEGPDFLTS